MTWVDLQASGSTQFAPNEIGFFDEVHPTTAGHGIIAAFADAVLTSDDVQFLDGSQAALYAGDGDDFIFARPIDPINRALDDDYTIYGGAGADVIFAGSGNVKVHGGSGSDLIAAGSDNAILDGGWGEDLLATNSRDTNLPNLLVGGQGDDALIANRAGANTLKGGAGDDLFVLKENASLVNLDHSFNFGEQKIVGGQGDDTLRLIINDQNAPAMQDLIAEFWTIKAAFDFAASHHAETFHIDGLDVTGIERLELQVNSVSEDPASPYLITHDIVLAYGHADPVSGQLFGLMHAAEDWGLLTV